MSVRDRVRWLIDALEAKYATLPDDAQSLRETFGEPYHSNSELRIETLKQREAVKTGLEEVMTSVQTEINDLRFTPLRLQNQTRTVVRLPTEILGLIFEEACFSRDAGETPEDAHDIGLRRTRKALCSTCFHFRDVAIRHARLWSTVVVTYRKKRHLPSVEQVTMELARAGNHPLSLRIRTGQVIWGSQRTKPLLAQILLVNTPYELLHLHEHGANSINLEPFINRALGSSVTKSLAITWAGHARGIENMPEVIDLRDMTSLHSLHLAFHRPHKMRFQHQEVSHITRLRLLGDMDLPSCIGLIDSCTRLESLYFNPSIRSDGAADSSARAVTHSSIRRRSQFQHLRHLHIVGLLEDADLLMRDVAFPNLLQLRLTIDNTNNEWPSDSAMFHNHQTRFPNLRVLELLMTKDTRTPNELAISFLRAHPSLEEVCLGLTEDVTPEMAQCLGGAPLPEMTERPQPNLRALGLYLKLVGNEELACLGEILRLRKSHGPASQPFALYVHTEPRMVGPDHPFWTIAAECGPNVTLKEEHYATTWAAEKNDNWWR